MSLLRPTDQAKLKKTSFKLSVCKNCGGEGHTKMTCKLLPKTQLKTTKPMKKVGKVAKKWTTARKWWFAENPPDESGLYHCYICGKPLVRDLLKGYGEYEVATLDHVKSRSRHPELRFELSNLRPCCWSCNEAKGSNDG